MMRIHTIKKADSLLDSHFHDHQGMNTFVVKIHLGNLREHSQIGQYSIRHSRKKADVEEIGASLKAKFAP